MIEQAHGDALHPPTATATFSDDELHRYELTRLVTPDDGAPARLPGAFALFCGLNPSTANAFKLDPTCIRETGFTRRWGFGEYRKVNAYGWRATLPADLWSAGRAGQDIVGNDNDEMVRRNLERLKRDGGVAIACWGTHAKTHRVVRLVELAEAAGVQWQCFGTNNDGSPKHPLYLPGSTQPQPWIPPWRLP